MRLIDCQPAGMMTKTKINQWLIESANQLAPLSEFPFIETQSILAFVMNQKREWLISHPADFLNEKQLQQANQFLARLKNGEPLPYITGQQAFFGLDFSISPEVLIPRPETELLVEECIQWFEAHPMKRKMADIGTGSGIIAVTLADRFNNLEVTAIDISAQALEIAKRNAHQLHVNPFINFIQNDLLEKCNLCFDLIAANLPYIPTKTLGSLSVSKYEPLLALDGGEEGLDLITRLLEQSPNHINPGGLVILEIEAGQSQSVLQMANSLFSTAKIDLINDLANHPRILKIQV